jgi:hypothetical protein
VATLFPNVTGAERLTGITRYRKWFLKNENNLLGLPNLTLYNSRAYIESISPGVDYYRLKAGTGTDVQSTADDYTGWAGVGILTTDIAGGTANFDIDAEYADGFEDGAELVISDGTNREFITLTSKGWVSTTASLVTSGVVNAYARAYDTKQCTTHTVSQVGSTLASYVSNYEGKLVRISAGPGVGQVRRIASNTTTVLTVTYPFAVEPTADSYYEILKTYVSQVVPLGDIVASTNGWTESGAGTYNEATYPVQVYPVGTIDQTWTITFTSAGVYNVSGSVVGTVVTGQTVTTDCKPINGSSYYFNIRAAGWGGSWISPNTITFNTVGSYKGCWCKQVVSSGAETCGDNTWNIRTTGDSV